MYYMAEGDLSMTLLHRGSIYHVTCTAKVSCEGVYIVLLSKSEAERMEIKAWATLAMYINS